VELGPGCRLCPKFNSLLFSWKKSDVQLFRYDAVEAAANLGDFLDDLEDVFAGHQPLKRESTIAVGNSGLQVSQVRSALEINCCYRFAGYRFIAPEQVTLNHSGLMNDYLPQVVTFNENRGQTTVVLHISDKEKCVAARHFIEGIIIVLFVTSSGRRASRA